VSKGLVSAGLADAFFESDGDGFVPTELTRGPWDPDAQHAGPPAALLGREIERHAAGADGTNPTRVGRITFEILPRSRWRRSASPPRCCVPVAASS